MVTFESRTSSLTMFDDEEDYGDDRPTNLRGYTPPEDRRRRGLHRKDQAHPNLHSGPILMFGLIVAALILVIWFLYKVGIERRKMIMENSMSGQNTIEKVIDIDPAKDRSVFFQV